MMESTLFDECPKRPRGVPANSHAFKVDKSAMTWRCIYCEYSPGGVLTIGPEGFKP